MQNKMADLGSPQDVLQAMDRLWFDLNIMKTMSVFVSEAPPPSSPWAAPAEEDSSKSDYDSTANSTPSEEQERSPTPASAVIIENHLQLRPSVSKTPFCTSPPLSSKLRRRRLEKMRCTKSFSELEDEELKGFRDLGFIFNKKEVNPYIKSMLPGLQMLGEKQDLTRPYLSEAWDVNRPDSPLLNFRIPPISASSKTDMKKHLRFWARTVAYVINEES